MSGTNRERDADFVTRWKAAGPELDAQRLAEVAGLTDEAARRATLDVFKLWRPSESDEFGDELVRQQRIFQRQQAGSGPRS
jgi:hypothetical protein